MREEFIKLLREGVSKDEKIVARFLEFNFKSKLYDNRKNVEALKGMGISEKDAPEVAIDKMIKIEDPSKWSIKTGVQGHNSLKIGKNTIPWTTRPEANAIINFAKNKGQ